MIWVTASMVRGFDALSELPVVVAATLRNVPVFTLHMVTVPFNMACARIEVAIQ